MADGAPIIERPNRDKGASKAARVAVVLLLVVSIVLVLVVAIGGADALDGANPVAFVVAVLYAILAFYVLRWNRGVLPVIAALAVLLAIFAGVAAPAWFERDKTGFDDPAMASEVLGLVCVIIVPVQALLAAFAMRGFAQRWNVEVERHPDDRVTGSGSGALRPA